MSDQEKRIGSTQEQSPEGDQQTGSEERARIVESTSSEGSTEEATRAEDEHTGEGTGARAGEYS